MALYTDTNGFPEGGFPVLSDVQDNLILNTLYQVPQKYLNYRMDVVGDNRLLGNLVIGGTLTGVSSLTMSGALSGVTTLGASSTVTLNSDTAPLTLSGTNAVLSITGANASIGTSLSRVNKTWLKDLNVLNRPTIGEDYAALVGDLRQYAFLPGRVGDILKIDEIQEFTSSNGVKIDGLILKDTGVNFEAGATTRIFKDGSNNLSFTDAVLGTKTLTELFNSSMGYPGAGIPISTGSAWGTSIIPSTGYFKYNGSAYQWVNETYSLSTHNHDSLYAPIGTVSSQWVTSGSDIYYNGGNVGIGTTDIEAWNSGFRAIEFGASSILGATGSGQDIFINSNAYYDGAWKYKYTNTSGILQMTGNLLYFRQAVSGTLDTVITWTTPFQINASGNVIIGSLNGLIKGTSGVLSAITSTESGTKYLRDDYTWQTVSGALPSGVQGDILYNNGTSWVTLNAGTSGYYLKTQGSGANPVWDNPSTSTSTFLKFASYYTDVSTSGTTETTLYSITLSSGFLNTNGDTIEGKYYIFGNSITDAIINLYIFGQSISFSNVNLGSSLAILNVTIIRVSNTTIRIGTKLSYSNAPYNRQIYVEKTGLDLGVTGYDIILKGLAPTSGSLTAKEGYLLKYIT